MQFLRDQEAAFPEANHIRNGKYFKPRSEYGQLTNDQKQHFWRFEFDDISKLLIMNAQIKIQLRYDEIKRSGFVREVDPKADNKNATKEDNPNPDDGHKGPSPKVGGSPSQPAGTATPQESSPLMKNIYNRLNRKPA